MAHLSLTAPEEFQVAFKPVMEAMMTGKALPEIELARFPETGSTLLAEWQAGYRQVFDAFSQADPRTRDGRGQHECPLLGDRAADGDLGPRPGHCR